METYYKPEDLLKFEEIGKEVQELAKKFFDYYGAVFSEENFQKGKKHSSPLPWRTLFSAPIV